MKSLITVSTIVILSSSAAYASGDYSGLDVFLCIFGDCR